MKKENNIWNIIFNKYLGISTDGNQTIIAFRNILYEMVDNIRKHTQEEKEYSKANGYISFYKNKQTNEFFICDNYEEGFLNTYLKTLKKEKKRIIKLHYHRIKELKKFNSEYRESDQERQDYRDIIQNYTDDINSLKNPSKENDLKILTKLFDTKESPKMHQAGRMIMHFGIPTLLDVLTKLGGREAHVDIFICMGKDRNYHIHYQDKKTLIEPLVLNNIKGTYIHISLPFSAEIEKPNNQPTLNINPITYKSLFVNSKDIQQKINTFQKFYFVETDYSNITLQEENRPFDESDDTKSKQIIVKYDKEIEKKYSVSDMLREIYHYTYKYNIQDVLITHFPIEEKDNYLKILIGILYKDETIEYKNDTLNIAFLNESFPMVAFIGGHNQKELCTINHLLSQTYNYNKDNFTKHLPVSSCELVINSTFFDEYEDKKYFLPFELFIENDKHKILYSDMLDNFLDHKVSKDLHVDVGEGYHTKKFYFLKSIFENSHNINRIAFLFAKYIDSFGFKNIVLVGTFKYSAQIISTTKSYLLKNEKDKVKTFMIYNLTEDYQEFKKFYAKNQSQYYFFFAPVTLERKNIQKFIEIPKNKLFYTAIHIFNKSMTKNIYALLHKDISQNIFNVDENDSCQLCFTENKERPLYQLDKDGYSIKNFYVKLPKKPKYGNLYNVSWKNSIYFGHTHRNMYASHYLYYIRTNSFYKENKKNIQHFVENLRNEPFYANIIDTKCINIALVPINETNQHFVELIEEKLFANNITIHYINLIDKEEVFHNITTLKDRYSYNCENCNFYFIDDEIATQNTLNLFRELLLEITDYKVKDFNKIFALIDRTTSLQNQFQSFTKIPIVPIKIGHEDCYLCEREKYFNRLMHNSSLVFMKQQFRLSVQKLQNRKTTEIEYKKLDFLKDFTNYLKMSAVEFIYKYINDVVSRDVSFQQIIKIFGLLSFRYLKRVYLRNTKLDDTQKNIVKRFCQFESRIALIKAVSFPKLIYFKDIRELAHNFIKNELIKVRNEIINDMEWNYLKDAYEPKYLDIDDIEIKIEPVLQNDEVQILKQLLPEITDYKKLNVDYMNSLMITSAYLNINTILDLKMIRFYYFLAREIKKSRPLEHQLLHKYPIAIKIITNYNKSKSKYFSEQLEKFLKDQFYRLNYKKSFSMIFSLYIENNLHLYKYSDEEIQTQIGTILQKNTFNDHINNLKTFLGNLFKKEEIEHIQLYIDANQDIEKVELIDTFANFEPLTNKESIEYTLFHGAVTKKSNSDCDDIELVKYDKDNTKEYYDIWCNYYHNDTAITYIRITDIQDNKIYKNDEDPFIPLALLVIKHEQKLINHLKVTQNILAHQQLLIRLLKIGNLLTSSITSYVKEKEKKILHKEKLIAQFELAQTEQKNEINELKFKHQISKASHDSETYLEAALDYSFLDTNNKIFHNIWKTYCNLFIADMYRNPNKNINFHNKIYLNCLDRYIQINNNTSVKEIDNQLKEKEYNNFTELIHDEPFSVFITLFIENIHRHNYGKCLITIAKIDNVLIIKNELKTKKSIDCHKINNELNVEPHLLGTKKGITFYTINRYLKKIGYKLKIECDSDVFSVKIIEMEKE
jgi:hypothetical protein